MSNKFLIGIGAAFFSVLILGIAAVVGVSSMTERAAVSTPGATTQPAEPSSSSPAQAPEVQSVEQPAPVVAPATPTAVSPAPVPAPVLDSDIARLAAAVKLGEPNSGGVSKEVWARETPVAEKLLQGLSDCDQRNWLKHFVKAGNEALSGSENYYQSLQELASLRRNDLDVAAPQASQ